MKQQGLGRRASGVLLPVFSLPSPHGIGCFSKEAYAFADFLADAGQTYWQVLPMGPTGYADSPYQSFSTFAGNPYFIDIDTLVEEGLLDRKTVARYDFGKDPARTDYGLLYRNRLKLLRHAYRAAKKAPEKRSAANAALREYALFMALKEAHGGRPWDTWEEGLRLRKRVAIAQAKERYADETGFQLFLQAQFAKQWKRLKAYANEKGVRIIGDLPIYVAFDSADVWANPELFYLDKDRRPVEVAGCPPDEYAVTGQLWGNPLYRWDVHRESGYAWWKERMKHALTLYDIVRIDHFRGFESYYAIPATDKTAERGVWRKGPGAALFRALRKETGEGHIIAEDLGFLTPAVHRMLRQCGYPGMKVLQFAFYPDEKGRFQSDYLPHRYDKNCVVYTGTHDNDTSCGWYESLGKKEAAFAARYLDVSLQKGKGAAKNAKEMTRALMRAAYASAADTAILPMQDLLLLGKKTRINTPSTVEGNWVWRMAPGACTPALARRLRDLTETYGR